MPKSHELAHFSVRSIVLFSTERSDNFLQQTTITTINK